MESYAALIAIELGRSKTRHQSLRPSTGQREQMIVKHPPAALQEWALGLRQRFSGRPTGGLS